MNPQVARLLGAPSQRFFKTSDNSLMQYLLLLYTELKDKAEAAEDPNEALWAADAACLILEISIRYDILRDRDVDFSERSRLMRGSKNDQ